MTSSDCFEVLRNLGELKETISLFGIALESNQKSLQPGHPTIATIKANLASMLWELGEIEEARKLMGVED